MVISLILLALAGILSMTTPVVNVSGFDRNDIGKKSRLIIHDMTGTRIKDIELFLEDQNDIEIPDIPGVYYLQVVTELNRYGAMIAVQ